MNLVICIKRKNVRNDYFSIFFLSYLILYTYKHHEVFKACEHFWQFLWYFAYQMNCEPAIHIQNNYLYSLAICIIIRSIDIDTNNPLLIFVLLFRIFLYFYYCTLKSLHNAPYKKLLPLHFPEDGNFGTGMVLNCKYLFSTILLFVLGLFSEQLWLFNGQVEDATAWDFFFPT